MGEKTGVDNATAKTAAIGVTAVGGLVAAASVASTVLTGAAVGVVGAGAYVVTKSKAPETAAKIEKGAMKVASGGKAIAKEVASGFKEGKSKESKDVEEK